MGRNRTNVWRRVYKAPADWTLTAYTYEQGPDYPRGKKFGQDVGEWIRGLQAEELQKDTKGIFAPVPLTYRYRWRAAGRRTRQDRAYLTCQDETAKWLKRMGYYEFSPGEFAIIDDTVHSS